MGTGSRRKPQGWLAAPIAALVLALLALPAGAQRERPGETAHASGSLPMPSAGHPMVIPSHPRLAEDRPAVILLDEIREPKHGRQPELMLGVNPETHARFVGVSAQGLLPPPVIQILCRQAMQALPLSASSRESDRIAAIYRVSPALAASVLAAESCHVSLGGALVAIPRELTRAVWGEEATGSPAGPVTGGAAGTATRCASRSADPPIAGERLSPDARLAATKMVDMLGELSTWASGPASKARGEYLSRLARLEGVFDELSSAAPGADAQVVGAMGAALGCFREAARAWPDVNGSWAVAEQNVRAAERSLGLETPAERREEVRQRAQEEQQAQAQRAARAREADARPAGKRLAATASGTAGDGSAANGRALLTKVLFNGSEYVHRWSKSGTNEFTPQGDEDLGAWKSMLTIVVYDGVRTGDDLAGVANSVLGAYRSQGKVLKVDSKPMTPEHEAEHFVAVVLGRPEFLEAVFARFLLYERTGIAVLYAKRVYGRRGGATMSAWLATHGPPVEATLMNWKGMPPVSALKALPQSR